MAIDTLPQVAMQARGLGRGSGVHGTVPLVSPVCQMLKYAGYDVDGPDGYCGAM